MPVTSFPARQRNAYLERRMGIIGVVGTIGETAFLEKLPGGSLARLARR
jgi:hypothetical protein